MWPFRAPGPTWALLTAGVGGAGSPNHSTCSKHSEPVVALGTSVVQWTRPASEWEDLWAPQWGLSVDTGPGQAVLPLCWPFTHHGTIGPVRPCSDLRFLYQETESGLGLTPSGSPMECAGFLCLAILTTCSSSWPSLVTFLGLARAKVIKPDPIPRGDGLKGLVTGLKSGPSPSGVWNPARATKPWRSSWASF